MNDRVGNLPKMDDQSEEECEAQSMVHINAASELFPKKSLLVEEDNSSMNLPFNTLSGESILFLGHTTDGVIAMSNFRLFINTSELGVINVPLVMIDQVEYRELFFLHIYCKDATYSRCSFPNSDHCLEWHRRLVAATYSPKKLEDLFAFPFYAWCSEEKKDDMYELLHYNVGAIGMIHEIERLGLDFHSSNGAWRVTSVNADYALSPTYPSLLVVPKSIEDEEISEAAEFRALHRFPAVVWRHRKNGCVLARCSQPEVGLFGWRGKLDEALVKAIAETCYQKTSVTDQVPNGDVTSSLPNGSILNDPSATEEAKKLLIVDARSYSAALANRAKGGGCECPEYYPNCEIQFMGLANIHSIRKSFQSLRLLCAVPPDQSSWYSALENTRWLHHIAALIKSAMCVVNAIDKDSRPVIVHCSDGWDRTPQITALAELMLDPYYRTIEGFQVLVEREWLEFGHKFGDRCGSGLNADDLNERCPVFLQWLDCIHQLMYQYPCSFEFDFTYLMKLVHHAYSCLFGTFLCNSESERHSNRVRHRTFSIWSFFKSFHNRFRNYLYVYKDRVLRPSCHIRDMHFWSSIYLPSKNSTVTCMDEYESSSNMSAKEESTCATSGNGHNLVKTRSCEDISVNEPVTEISSDRQRRLSDPNIVDIQRASLNAINVDVPFDAKDEALPTDECGLKTSDCRETAENTDEISEAGDESEKTDIAVDSTVHDGPSTPEVESLPNSESSSSATDDKTLKNRRLTGIDGSTDTLVGEGGTVNPSSNNSNCDNSSLANKFCDGDGTVRTDTASFACTKSVSTSTTELSDPCVPTTMTGDAMTYECRRHVCLSCSISNQNPKPKKKSFSRQVSNSSALSSVCSTPVHSRTPSSGFPATPNEDCRALSEGQEVATFRLSQGKMDIDGLTLATDNVQQRLEQLFTAHKAEVEALKRDLYITRLALSQQVCSRCNGCSNAVCQDHNDEVVSLPDSTFSGENQSVGHESNDAVDVGWEHVNEKDTHPTLWVPDHAVSRCSYCDIEFWLGRRKHHCRSCGKIFCAQCSDHLSPIPNEQLYYPVRVCKGCYDLLHSKFKSHHGTSMMSCGTGCKNKIIGKSQSIGTAEALN